MNEQTNAPITDAELAEWERLCEAATPGPWFYDSYSTIHSVTSVKEYDRIEGTFPKSPDAVTDKQWDSLPETEVCAVPVQGGDTATEQGNLDAKFIEKTHTVLPRAVAEIRRLRAIIAKLPVTADGVPVVPGMAVWLPGGGQYPGEVESVGCGNALLVNDSIKWPHPPLGLGGEDSQYSVRDGDELYSTREAAEAAKEAK